MSYKNTTKRNRALYNQSGIVNQQNSNIFKEFNHNYVSVEQHQQPIHHFKDVGEKTSVEQKTDISAECLQNNLFYNEPLSQ